MKQVFSLGTALLAMGLLVSCTAASNYYEHLKHTSSLRYFVSDEEKLARYQKACKSIGITEESQQWESCLLSAKSIDEEAAARRSATSTARARACSMDPANC